MRTTNNTQTRRGPFGAFWQRRVKEIQSGAATASADVHMRPHVRRLISFMTGEAAEVVSRLIACASCDVTLFVNGVLSALLSACGEITLPLVFFFPFYSFNLTTVRQSWDKTKIPTGALRVRMSSSLGPGRP